MIRSPTRLYAVALCAVAAFAAGCSGETGAAALEMAWADSVFAGFHLGEPHDPVLAEARHRGIEVDCISDEMFDPFCTGPLERPAGKPALSFGFRGGRLVSLARSAVREKGTGPFPDWKAHYRRALGEPVLNGWMNPYIHVTMWTNSDTTLIGTVTCTDPADRSTCEMGLDDARGTNLLAIVDDWRGMIERTPQRR